MNAQRDRGQGHLGEPNDERAQGGLPRLKSLATEPWPRGISRQPTMNIGAVLGVLKREFPAVSHSKIRFLEEQGLVTPQRTPAGYRVFSAADVERLRFALAAQRDSFLPLRVIRDRLASMDAGLDESDTALVEPGVAQGVPARLTAAELSALTGATDEHLSDLSNAGLISTDSAGRYPAHCLGVVTLSLELVAHGIDTRHLRLMRSAADRQVDVVAQVVAPLRGRTHGPQDARARELAMTTANDLSGMLSRLHSALVSAGVERIF